MLKYGIWDLPGFDYFTSKNTFIGSKEGLRFKVTPRPGDESSDPCFFVEIWSGEKCYELSEISVNKEFPFCEQSIYDINTFLSETKRSGNF